MDSITIYPRGKIYIDRIMALIKENADKINEEEVEVLEPDIQGNKKKKNKK